MKNTCLAMQHVNKNKFFKFIHKKKNLKKWV